MCWTVVLFCMLHCCVALYVAVGAALYVARVRCCVCCSGCYSVRCMVGLLYVLHGVSCHFCIARYSRYCLACMCFVALDRCTACQQSEAAATAAAAATATVTSGWLFF